MIVKMKFVSITGPKSDIDRVVNRYLSRYEIHLENALTELSSVRDLSPYLEENPYKEPLRTVQGYKKLLDEKVPVKAEGMTALEAVDFVKDLENQLSVLEEKQGERKEKYEHYQSLMEQIEPFRQLHANVRDLLDFQFIQYRFGRIPQEFFDKFRHFMYENFNTYFYKCKEDKQYVWGVYFMAKPEAEKIDAVFSSMHFERIDLPDEYQGTPEEAFRNLQEKCDSLKKEAEDTKKELTGLVQKEAGNVLGAEEVLSVYSKNFDIRRKAALTRKDQEAFFILCGWMAKDDVPKLQADMSQEENVILAIEEEGHESALNPPVKLKNPKIVKPYEMYVQMYGLPNYREIDPTIFIAITYSFIFGAMYGDFGQGLVLLIGGFLLYKFKHIPLAGIISCAGVFSCIFGWLFGSFFGFEDSVIKTHWLAPRTQMMQLKGIGNINSVLVYAIVFGMFMILLTMVLHIINAVREHDTKEIFFGTNSLSGFVFYLGVIIAVFVLFGSSGKGLATAFIMIFFVIPLVLMFCKDPLTNLVEKKKKVLDDSAGMFIVQSFFEMFEVLLSFFSNTLSFVRIGAFAVSHAAMMEVVLMLAGATNGGSPNWGVIIGGNVFVMGMEGLIVGIQVLRLEYYEFFSRFYKGDGKPFTPAFAKPADTSDKKAA